jgi:hypothetical protein
MRVAADLGHGGPVSEYRIESGADGYAVTLRISRPLPGPGESPLPPTPPPRSLPPRPLPPPGATYFEPSQRTEMLAKERDRVEEFLEKLADEFRVYELTDLRPAHPFLHPTFYTFSFLDSAGGQHGFNYRIEGANHLDARYRELVEEFESFFESRRVFAAFFESRRG